MIILIPEADREKTIYEETFNISVYNPINISMDETINTFIKKDTFEISLNNKLYIILKDNND